MPERLRMLNKSERRKNPTGQHKTDQHSLERCRDIYSKEHRQLTRHPTSLGSEYLVTHQRERDKHSNQISKKNCEGIINKFAEHKACANICDGSSTTGQNEFYQHTSFSEHPDLEELHF